MLKYMLIVVLAVTLFCLMFLVGAVVVKAGEPVVEFVDLRIGDLQVQGFELTDKSEVDLEAVVAGASYSKHLLAYGWIIDADNRELVWSMQDDCDEFKRISDVLKDCQETIRLQAGKYEAYYYVGTPGKFWGNTNITVNDLGDIIALVGDIFTDEDKDVQQFCEDELEELTFVIQVSGGAKAFTPLFDEVPNTVVSILQPEDDEYHSRGFTLKREMPLDIYAIGEFSDSYDLFVDGGWIIDARTRETVWRMDKWNTERAGGAAKNRVYIDGITLPAGDYIAYYATDESHDPGEWNSPPPADPLNYGMVIRTADAGDFSQVTEFDQKLSETEIVKMVRIRDDELKKQGFALKDDTRLHITALGERNYSDNDLADYGWIVDMDEMETVWKMKGDECEFAGGAAKNCIFDGFIYLPAGHYMAYYRTDGSHSYGSWNAGRPHDYRNWGITVVGMGDEFSADDFELVDQFQPSGNMLVNMTGLGDDEDVRQSFSLSETARLKIMALGEGQSGEMHDYGWIENDRTGEIVWEMTYRKSRNAGGASKNRMVTANVTLEKGKYTAFFVTDGSHSLEDFNASEPDEPERWGMVITQK
ncbi:MAG: hypothetical protein GY841_02605 [FCB group bacterium]|nr:hypothetical protein [FCB group bacterium]